MKNYKNKSVMKHQFSEVPKAQIPRSSFNRSHGYKTTFDAGYLVPFFVDEVLPGDTFNLKANLFGRLNTPVTPFMDNLHLDTFFFAVPLRLLWENFERFMGSQDNPTDSVDYVVPQVNPDPADDEWLPGTIADYFGLPTEVSNLSSVSALPFRAYNLIYNEWFRDQNLQDSVTVNTDDGPDAEADYSLLKRGKRHDYFTSCLPWPQKGPGVELPLGTSAPISADGAITFNQIGAGRQGFTLEGAGVAAAPAVFNIRATGGTTTSTVGDDLEYESGLVADLSTATAATINSLRQAFQLQRMYERDARGGTRYTEIVKSHFGVTSPDSRLQRPEYLGGSSTPVEIHAVQQTSSTDATSPQGNLAAFGQVVSLGKGFSKSFTEHCIVIGMMSVRADLTYQQGINRMWNRETREDFYFPALAHLGEQAVLNKEIYADGVAADDEVFGYQERWAEYRYKPSMITGKLRSIDATSLDVWHLSQFFNSLPTLGSDFIEENPPIDRVVAVNTEPDFVLDAYIDLKCVRPMPVYSVPGLIDHF